MKKFVLWILGASIFYVIGAITVRYNLFPYTQVLDFKNRISVQTKENYLKNNHYLQELELYDIYHTKESKIVMLGDSITFGVNWCELLNDVTVINRGINADTTEGFLNRLKVIYKLNPQYVFIMGGINDIRKGYNVNDVFDNYKILIERLKTRNITPVVQSTLFTVNVEENKKVKELNILLIKYCKRNKIDFIDLNDELSENDMLIKDYTYDGIHLKSNGYEIWRDKLEKYFLKNV